MMQRRVAVDDELLQRVLEGVTRSDRLAEVMDFRSGKAPWNDLASHTSS